MLRLQIDRFRLLMLPLLIAGLLLLAFALAVGAQPALSISITFDSNPLGEVASGSNVTFTIIYSSSTPVTPTLPGRIEAKWSENASFVSASDGKIPNDGDRGLLWEYPDIQLASTQIPTLTLTAVESSGAIVVTATLVVSGTSTPFTNTVTVPIVAPVNREVATTSSEVDLSQSSLVISPTGTITAGSPITLTVIVSNTGGAPAGAVLVSLSETQKLENLAIVEASPPVAEQVLAAGNNFAFRLSEPLQARQDARVLLTARVAPSAEGELQVTGLISATGNISVPLNSSTVTVLGAKPRLTMQLDQPESVIAGGEIMMGLIVSNIGTIPAEDVQVVVRTSPRTVLIAEGGAIASQSQTGNELTMVLSSIEVGSPAQIRLTGVAQNLPGTLIIDVTLPDTELGDPASLSQMMRQIAVQPADTPTPPATVTPSPIAPTPTPTPTPRVVAPPAENPPLLAIGIVALLAALIAGIALYFLGRGRGKSAPPPLTTPVDPQQPGPGAVIVPPPPPTGSAALESVAMPGLRLRLDPGVTTIGRAPDSTIRIDERYMNWETVSREHAKIQREGDYYVIYDVSDRNGVYVEGQRTARNVLRPGWRIGIGGVEFIFRDATAADQ